MTISTRHLALRAPGNNPFTSPRKEPDIAEIYSGIFEGKTTGAPISIIIMNTDADSSKYEPIKNLLRPGHANYTYTKNMAVLTIEAEAEPLPEKQRVGKLQVPVANKILQQKEITIISYMKSIGNIDMPELQMDIDYSQTE